MNINISNATVNRVFTHNPAKRKVLLIGPGNSSSRAREIILPSSQEEVLSIYGNSDLYKAYSLLKELEVENVYVCNCFANSDYIRVMDKIMHYDFDFLVPIGIYFSDTFYNAIEDEDQYFVEYILKQLSLVNSLTTVIMTEKHASLYEDFDHFVIEMKSIENNFIAKYDYTTSQFLESYGNNLLFVYNSLENVSFANAVLAGLFINRSASKYLPSLKINDVVFNIDNIDMIGLRAMYFKKNFYTKNVTVENAVNFKKTQDIYSNALVDDVIKQTIKNINLDSYKGKVYNQYTSLQIEASVKKALQSLKGVLFKEYTIDNIYFKKTDITAGCIIIDFSIVPYGTLENINVIMGV